MKSLLPLALLLLTSCGGGSQVPSSLQSLDGGVEPLRSAFDAATGKVRAIFLASPT